jgi:hypothetical protein
MQVYSKMSRYGITREQFWELVETQNGSCAICGVKPESPTDLHIDHDHKTGKVRGLLCQFCNQGLGSFREDPRNLEKAVEYIKRTNS